MANAPSTATASSPRPAEEPLLAEFPPATWESWKTQVEAELKGASFEKKMFTPTYEGITLKPIYRREDIEGLPHVASLPGFGPFVRGSAVVGRAVRAWDVSQEIAVADAAGFNAAARSGLARGLTALNMVVDMATRSGADPDWAPREAIGAGGVSVASLGDLRTALEGIDLAKVPLFVRTGASGMPVAALIMALLRERGTDPGVLRGCIEMDPLGVLAHEGRLAQSLDGAYREMAALTGWGAANAPGLKTVCVHTRPWHEAGGHAAQELGFALATALDYARALMERGLDFETVAPRFRFSITAGTRFFLEIAKLRAARMLWARVASVLRGSPAAQRTTLHVRTSLFNKTVHDPTVNLLRTTVEAFAGVLGGCDSLQVGAFDEVLRTPDAFSQRIARNQQLVLRDECQLTEVTDPAGGSWYVEALTAELAARAWDVFQEIERRGGMAKAMQAGWPQAEVATVAEARLAAAARRRDSIVGTNFYANPTEQPLERRADVDGGEGAAGGSGLGLEADPGAFRRRRAREVAAARTTADVQQHQTVLNRLSRIVGRQASELFEACVDAVAAGATLGEVTRAVRIHDQPDPLVVPVVITRAAVGYEALRGAVDAAARAPGGAGRPRIFLANMGPPKQHRARAEFARCFLEVAGFEVTVPRGFDTPEAAVAAAVESGAGAVCLCSADETYPALVPAVVAGLRAARPGTVVILAGYPPDQVEAHKAAGVDEFIHLRADALEVLTAIAKRLGVAV
ncbi:MAG: methylmalonyl-CoA mutase family protein [Limisphaerales bacterium]